MIKKARFQTYLSNALNWLTKFGWTAKGDVPHSDVWRLEKVCLQAENATQQTGSVLIVCGRIKDYDDLEQNVIKCFSNYTNITLAIIGKIDAVSKTRLDAAAQNMGATLTFINVRTDLFSTFSYEANAIVGNAYALANASQEALLGRSVGDKHNMLLAFDEILSMRTEDWFFEKLRILAAVRKIIENTEFNVCVVAARAEQFSFPLLDISIGHYGMKRTYYYNGRNIYAPSSLGEEEDVSNIPEPKPQAPFPALLPPPSFYSETNGPIRPVIKVCADDELPGKEGYFLRFEEVKSAVEKIEAKYRLLGVDEARNNLADCSIEKYGDDGFMPNDDWVCIIIDLSNRIFSKLYMDIIERYVSNKKLLILNRTPPDATEYKSLERLLSARAACCHVLRMKEMLFKDCCDLNFSREDILEVAKGIEQPFLKTNILTSKGVTQHFLGLMSQVIVRNNVHKVMNLAHHALALFRAYNVNVLLCFPSRKTFPRTVSQSARILGIPSLEIQTVLGGKIARHRCPNADYISAVEKWSMHYFKDFFGFPEHRILLGGSNRYDEILAQVGSVAGQRRAVSLRQELEDQIQGMDCQPYVILFGTQPVSFKENKVCLEAILRAIKDKSHVLIVVKPHPAELDIVKNKYRKVCEGGAPNRKVLISRDIDTYDLMMACDLIISQTSNILLEAAILGRRSVSLQFGGCFEPVDFRGMNASFVFRNEEQACEGISEIISAKPGSHPIDAMRAQFLQDNATIMEGNYYDRIKDLIAHVQVPVPAAVKLKEDMARLENFDPKVTGNYE